MTCRGQNYETEFHCSCYYDAGRESWEDRTASRPAEWYRCCACGEVNPAPETLR